MINKPQGDTDHTGIQHLNYQKNQKSETNSKEETSVGDTECLPSASYNA